MQITCDLSVGIYGLCAKQCSFHQNGRGWVGSRAGSLPIGLVMKDNSKAVGEARGNPPLPSLLLAGPSFHPIPQKRGGWPVSR